MAPEQAGHHKTQFTAVGHVSAQKSQFSKGKEWSATLFTLKFSENASHKYHDGVAFGEPGVSQHSTGV